MSRLVVKVGSSSLTTPDGHIDPDRIGTVVDAVARARSAGDEVVLVSSGAIAAGLGPLGLRTRPRDLATQQAAASVGQGALVEFYGRRFAQHGLRVGQVLLTLDDVTRRSHYRNAHQTFAKLLELGVVPIVNENDTVATSEIRFGDNDRLAALVSHLVHADELVLLSDVDALYTGHPDLPASRRIEIVGGDEDLAEVDVSRVGSAVGTGGMVTKVEAARIATAAGIPVVLTSAALAGEALRHESVGTRFVPTGKRRPTRLLWLAHASETKGRLTLDDGAVRAITERKASLLAAGVAAVDGTFTAGDPVDLVRLDGTVVARGLVNFDARELPTMVGRSSHELVELLGPEYEREVVHRDDLVVL
ncbi:glutamate 5-kinase [Aeromicrobium camelliae]|uniref:Glutamate 5-kinase n=1 Tax=Aeromicrobium camelliae TaxID=1538144 RepID=A0A3N6X2R6_9ACTN|nr:glutamate 5-kinase [Aeromicrobium camelliae]RQN08395.1 glutamate 5-kinase [Aeromicrobium camelliae]